MITPFGLRHIRLVRQLQGASAPVDRRSSLIEDQVAPLRSALRGYFFRPTAGIFTYVLRGAAHDPRLCGFVQASALRPPGPWAGHRPGPALNMAHIAPLLDHSEEAATVWYRLLLHLCIAAGEQQVQRLFARLSDDSPAEDVFRQAGFAVYSRERIFSRSSGQTKDEASNSAVVGQLSARMHQVHAEDRWDMQRLWIRVTPSSVLHAEGSNESHGNTQLAALPFSALEHGYVCRSDKGKMQGYLHLLLKPRGAWLRLLLYPEASDCAAEILDHALAVLRNHPPRPIYCAVREYEGGMESVLGDRGFVHAENHSLLVKHTTVRVREPRRQLVPSLEKRAEIAPTVSGSKASEM